MAGTGKTRPSKTRIAVVDDFRLVVDGLASRLSDEEFGLDVAIQSDTWSDLLSHPAFPVDVTVLDLNLKDSVSITAKIKALRSSGSEVVVISRQSHPATVSRVLKAGALSFVAKTDSVQDLVDAISCAAQGAVHLSAALAAEIERIDPTPGPRLGLREKRALALYSGGLTMKEVATEMSTTEETIKSYIKRARRKYRDHGIDLGSRMQLRQHGMNEGWIHAD